jgi:N-acetylmuramoyl-L-alanine amidase
MIMATRHPAPFLRRAAAAATLVLLVCRPDLAFAQNARTLFERAEAREQTVLEAAVPAAATLRSVALAFENVVRRYPTSGFCDDSLWKAAGLMRRAHELSGAKADRESAARYLEWLRREYPHSAYQKQIPAAIDALEPPAAPAPRPTPPAAAASDQPEKPEAAADTAGPVAALTSITRTTLPQGDRITLEFSHEVAYVADRVTGPDRVFFDFNQSAAETSVVDQAGAITGSLVKALRVGKHPGQITRVVLELDGQPRYSAFPMYEPFRLVIDLESDRLPLPRVPAEPAPASRVAPTPTTATTATPATTNGPSPKPEGSAPAPSAPAGPPPAPPASTARGDYTLARQLGLGVSRVVIDPGHGGHDPGAMANGLREAELVLDVSMRVKKLLESHPGIEVVLTRDTDSFIALEERTEIANREHADMFLSIHANASRQTATRGVETYLLNFATNPSAEAVAARENATSAQSMNTLPTLVRSIMMNNKLKESRELATMVQTSLVRSLRPRNPDLRDLGIKQAPFVVLIGAQMPSVLAEISFLTNRGEASLLKQSAYRDRIAQALADAVLKYQASLKKVTTETPQPPSGTR